MRPLAFGPGVSFGQPALAAEGLRAWRVTLITAKGERTRFTALARGPHALQRLLDTTYPDHRAAATMAVRLQPAAT